MKVSNHNVVFLRRSGNFIVFGEQPVIVEALFDGEFEKLTFEDIIKNISNDNLASDEVIRVTNK